MIKLFNHIKETYSIDNVEIKDNNPLFNKLVKRKDYRKFVISLENKEQVWRNIQKSKRKAVKKAQREGITTREVQKKEINKLCASKALNKKKKQKLTISMSKFF